MTSWTTIRYDGSRFLNMFLVGLEKEPHYHSENTGTPKNMTHYLLLCLSLYYQKAPPF